MGTDHVSTNTDVMMTVQLKDMRSVFGALCEVIVYQQLSNKAAATIFGRLCALFPRGPAGLAPDNLQALTDLKIRSCGISRPKLKSLRNLARQAAAGEIKPEDIDDARFEHPSSRVRLTTSGPIELRGDADGLKSAIELNRVHVRSLGLIEELKTLVNDGGSIAADGGKNDDRVMAAALAPARIAALTPSTARCT